MKERWLLLFMPILGASLLAFNMAYKTRPDSEQVHRFAAQFQQSNA
jgi:hypothetical protein